MIDRRMLLGAAAGMAASPVLALEPADTDAWIAYEQRLRDRLADAGGGRFSEALARELLDQTNAARAANGAGACRWNPELATVARAHAGDLAGRGYVEHLTPEGFDPSHRVGLIARRLIGSASENIAYRRAGAPATAAQLMTGWRNSPPHWTNLLRPTHTDIGLGVAVRGERTYAVGLYARPDGALGAPLPFRLDREADLAAAIGGASPPLDGFSLTDPVDEQRPLAWTGHQILTLAPGIYQLRPRRQVAPGRHAVYWGPIFVRS